MSRDKASRVRTVSFMPQRRQDGTPLSVEGLHGQLADPQPVSASPHDLLSTTHADTLPASVADGSIIIGNVTPKWAALAISVPAAGLINHLAVANGETRPSWKALFDATVPTTIAESAAAAAGTAVVAARRDHTHGSPATFPPTAHNVLSASHGDALADTVARGDVLYGNATPKWARLGLTANAVVGSDATDVKWLTTLPAAVQANIGGHGAWTAHPFNAGDFTAGGAMTWTVAAGDVTNFTYLIMGKTMFLSVLLTATTVGGTPGQDLRIAIPGGKLAQTVCGLIISVNDNGGGLQPGIAYAAAGAAYFGIYRTALANWSASTNNTAVNLFAIFEIQ